MGCCCSLFKKDSGPDDEPNETTRLLIDPVNSSPILPSIDDDIYSSQYQNSLPKTTDEQSALNKILQDTAANVIDVGALDSHNLEQHEYIDRSRTYAKKIEIGGIRVSQTVPCILKDIPAPERVLAADPIAQEDRELIKNMLKNAVVALQDVKVEHKEDLVVPFIA